MWIQLIIIIMTCFVSNFVKVATITIFDGCYVGASNTSDFDCSLSSSSSSTWGCWSQIWWHFYQIKNKLKFRYFGCFKSWRETEVWFSKVIQTANNKLTNGLLKHFNFQLSYIFYQQVTDCPASSQSRFIDGIVLVIT